MYRFFYFLTFAAILFIGAKNVYFDSESPRQHSCKVGLKLAQWCRRSFHLKKFFSLSFFSSDGPYVHWCGTNLAILVKVLLR